MTTAELTRGYPWHRPPPAPPVDVYPARTRVLDAWRLRAALAERAARAEHDAACDAPWWAAELEAAEHGNPLRAAQRAACTALLEGRKLGDPVRGVGLVREVWQLGAGLAPHDADPERVVLVLPCLEPGPAVAPQVRRLAALLAVSPRDPAWWAWHSGEADGLGWPMPGEAGKQLRLHGTPFGWLLGVLAAQRGHDAALAAAREAWRRAALARSVFQPPEFDPTFRPSARQLGLSEPPFPGAGRVWRAAPNAIPWGQWVAEGVRVVVVDDKTAAAALFRGWPMTTRRRVRIEVARAPLRGNAA